MNKFSLTVLIILIFICVAFGIAVLKNSLLQIAFLNVGKGNSILITTPTGNRVLIDGGPDKSVLQALGRAMPFYEHSIDFVLATTQKSSDIGGVPFVLDRFNVKTFADSGNLSGGNYRAISDEIAQKNISHISVNIGDDISLGGGAHFLISSAGAEITGKIVYGSTAISIPADIPSFASSTDDIVLYSDGENISR